LNTLNTLNISIAQGSIDFGNVNVGQSAQTDDYHFNLTNHGIACFVTVNATVSQNWTFVNYTDLGHDVFCVNISKDNWTSEFNVKNDGITELASLPIDSFQLFDIKVILPTSISHSSNGESFNITFTTTAI